MPARQVEDRKPRRKPSPGVWTCQRCGYTKAAYAPVERHVDSEHGGGRIICHIR